MDGVTSTKAELLAKIKREIQDKTYKVKLQEIAENITQKLRADET